MPFLACGCWIGHTNRTALPNPCDAHAGQQRAIVLDPTTDLRNAAAVIQQVRVALSHHPIDGGAAQHEMDRGTADLISRMLTADAPAPNWVWQCFSPDGCDNRICRLAHLIKQAKQAERAAAVAPARQLDLTHVCVADDCCTAAERDACFEARHAAPQPVRRCWCGCGLDDHGPAHL